MRRLVLAKAARVPEEKRDEYLRRSKIAATN
jgi:hypothetical protein